MERVTPEQVVAAYRATNIKPQRQEYYSKDRNCGCPLTALAAQAGIDPSVPDAVANWADDEYGYTYSRAFVCGVDEPDDDDYRRTLKGLEADGFDDGKAAWEAVRREWLAA